MADLGRLIAAARARWDAMTPEERDAMLKAQAASYARAEAAFGSDADEAEYRAALESGDPERIAEVKRKEAERLARATTPTGAGRGE
jgi:TRAP-type C4-dicarboxylate transport system substrate-binding protein